MAFALAEPRRATVAIDVETKLPDNTLAPVEPTCDAYEPELRIVPMSLADYLAIEETKQKIEWVDGWAVYHMSPAMSDHGWLQIEIGVLLRQSLPTCSVHADSGLNLNRSRRVPDLTVFPKKVPSQHFIADVPIIAVEILSSSTREQDEVFKRAEYALAGIGQYWLVDPQYRRITVLNNSSSNWGAAIEINREQPQADILVEGYGTVHIDIDELMPPE